MNVSSEDIRKIKPGAIGLFVCEDAPHMQTAASLIGQVKRYGLPDGIVDYEYRKHFDEGNIILIHALRDGEERILNR